MVAIRPMDPGKEDRRRRDRASARNRGLPDRASEVTSKLSRAIRALVSSLCSGLERARALVTIYGMLGFRPEHAHFGEGRSTNWRA